MAKIIQLQRDDTAQFRPVIVDDSWTVLRATETEPLDDARIVAAAQSADALLFPLSVWKANESLLAGRDKAITGVWLAPEDEPGDAEAFFDRVSKMPRIVSAKDIVMSDAKEQNNEAVLKISGKVVTFRYLSDEEMAQQKDAEKDKKKKGGK